jgi:phosphonate transport system substrate-binding protein
MRLTHIIRALAALVGFLGLTLAPPSAAQDCKNRGQLDAAYCDNDNDLIADPPTDPRRWKDPATFVFAFAPVEDPVVYQNTFRPLMESLGQCTGKRVIYYPVQTNSAQIEAMRAGRLHVAGFSTGPTGFAVNLAGAVPFAAKAMNASLQGYHLVAIVKKDTPYQKLSDLKGKRVAHSSRSSYSGNIAPRVLFPPQGLTPDVDYTPLMSGGHDKSALGVASGDYDMAAVASSVLARMTARGTAKDDDFRVIYKSPLFPTSSFAYAHDLKPDLAKKIRDCFYAFRFTPTMIKNSAPIAFCLSRTRNTGRWCARSPRRPACRSTERPMKRNRTAKLKRSLQISNRDSQRWFTPCENAAESHNY